jgi:hypothetical protein
VKRVEGLSYKMNNVGLGERASRYQKRLHITGKLDQVGANFFTCNLRQRLHGRLVQPLTHLLHHFRVIGDRIKGTRVKGDNNCFAKKRALIHIISA